MLTSYYIALVTKIDCCIDISSFGDRLEVHQTEFLDVATVYFFRNALNNRL